TGGVTLSNAGNFAGSGTLSLAGTNSVTLPVATTNANTINVNGATLVLGNAASLGTGTLSLTSGTVQTAVATLANPLNFTCSGAGTLTGASTIVVNDTLTLNGALSGTGSLTQLGSGTLVLAPATNSTFSGGFTLNTGASPGAASAALCGTLVLGTNNQPLGA